MPVLQQPFCKCPVACSAGRQRRPEMKYLQSPNDRRRTKDAVDAIRFYRQRQDVAGEQMLVKVAKGNLADVFLAVTHQDYQHGGEPDKDQPTEQTVSKPHGVL